MTVALEKNSNEIVHGSALRALGKEHIQANDYVCPDDKCLMPATPSSYKKTNKPASYFKYKVHSPDCIVTIKKQKSLSTGGKTKEDFCPYIDELKEPERHKQRHGIKRQGTSNKTESRTTSPPPSTKEGKTTRYLDAAIDYYLDETMEAENRTLKLPKHPKKTYKATFQLITDNKQYNSGHIFYSKLKFNTPREDPNGCITLTLLPKNDGIPYRLKINTSKWNGQKKKHSFLIATLHCKRQRSIT
ncbi:hypothetical protein [Vibrio harveyi]|uniref:hypothetical protein n=1 Tax=Vibrio harveyi TaxID=669 RepID=UPI004063B83D